MKNLSEKSKKCSSTNNRLFSEEWLRTEDVCKYLGITKNALWILVSRGLLLKRKFQGRLYFKKSELNLLIESTLK